MKTHIVFIPEHFLSTQFSILGKWNNIQMQMRFTFITVNGCTYNICITPEPVLHHWIYVIFQKLSNFIISQIIKLFPVLICSTNVNSHLHHLDRRIFAIFCYYWRTIFFSASFVSVAIYYAIKSFLIAPLKVRTQVNILVALFWVNHLVTVFAVSIKTLGVVLLLLANIFALSTTN